VLAQVKKTKRRTVQLALQRQGKAEQTLVDPALDEAVQRFYSMERQLKNILSNLKESRKGFERFAVANAALGNYISIPFSGKESHDAFEVANGMTRLSDIVAPSCMAILQAQAIQKIENLLESAFPARKRRIAEISGLQLDVESYSRRVKASENKSPESATSRWSNKLETTQSKYNMRRQELLDELSRLHQSFDDLMEPVYAAFMASQLEFHGFIHSRLARLSEADSSAGPAIARTRIAIQDLIAVGGPEVQVPKPKEGLFSRLQGWGASKRNQGILTSPGPSLNDSQFSPNSDRRHSDGMMSPSPTYGQEPFSGHSRSSVVSRVSQNGPSHLTSPVSHRSGMASPTSSVGTVGTWARQQQAANPKNVFDNSMDFAGPEGDRQSQQDALDQSVDQHQYQHFQPERQEQQEHGERGDQQREEQLQRGYDQQGQEIEYQPELPEHTQQQEQQQEEEIISPGAAILNESADTSANGDSEEKLDNSMTEPKSAQDSKKTETPPDGVLETVIAAFKFESSDPVDLPFKKGDEIKIIGKVDEGWWKGELNGRSGLVPVNYFVRKP